MAFVVDVDVDASFEADCSVDRALDVLTDVPWSASHFPKVDKLVELDEGVYRWEMAKIGMDAYNIQTVYACKYTHDRDKGWVKWTPVKGEGNSKVSGKWTIKALKDGGTRLKLTTTGEMELPFPRLAKMVIAPFVRSEFEGMIETYIEKLTKTLESNKKKPKSAVAKKK